MGVRTRITMFVLTAMLVSGRPLLAQDYISFQCHWPNSLNPFAMAHAGHIEFPKEFYGKKVGAGDLTVPFRLVVFHADGEYGPVWTPEHIMDSTVTWDATGTTEPPPLVADPHGVRTYTGKVTFHIPSTPFRGWQLIMLVSRFHFESGDILNTVAKMGIYVETDPNIEETPIPGAVGPFHLGANCDPQSSRSNIPGELPAASEMHGSSTRPVPGVLSPFSTPQIFESVTYEYGPARPDLLGAGTFELRLDPDLHNGIPGTLLATRQGRGSTENFDLIDPAKIGRGPHKLSFIWKQIGTIGEEVNSLLVVPITIGDEVPTPSSPPPSQPPLPKPPLPVPGPAVKTCNGTVSGTMDGSGTLTIGGGAIRCQQ
jgi:hypothetical protein